MPSKMWDEITYPFLNFNGATLYNGCNYLSMLGLKLNHVSKRGHWWLAKHPLKTNGSLANRQLTSLIKEVDKRLLEFRHTGGQSDAVTTTLVLFKILKMYRTLMRLCHVIKTFPPSLIYHLLQSWLCCVRYSLVLDHVINITATS